MSHRIRFIARQAKQILVVDLSHCLAAEVENVLREVPEVVTTRPCGSVLIISARRRFNGRDRRRLD